MKSKVKVKKNKSKQNQGRSKAVFFTTYSDWLQIFYTAVCKYNL